VILRAHHLLCILGFRGLGYSAEFTSNMSRIVERLRAHPHTLIEVVTAADDICSPCPFLDDGRCRQKGAQSEEAVRHRDLAVMARLGLATADKTTWSGIEERLRLRMKPQDLNEICGDCQWLSLGYCAEGLEQLGDRGER
jgi:hypothetical protein